MCKECHKKGAVMDGGLRDKRPQGSTSDIGSGHTSQWYGDNQRVSWDGIDQDNVHWTNQELPKDHPGRHNPPDDTKR